jgi:hypothetical protein
MNKAQLQTLKDEIANDPLTRGYSGMTDAQIADDLNTEYRERNLDRLDASTVFNAINKAELNALTDANKATVWNILHLGQVNPFGLEAEIFVDIFSGGSQTITELEAIRKQSQSRAVELGLPFVWEGFVIDAKAL